MPSNLQRTEGGSRHNSPPSHPNHHAVDIYSDALEIQTVSIKTADGNRALGSLTKGLHDESQPLGRPSSSDSGGEFGTDVFQGIMARDLRLLTNFAVTPSTDQASEADEAKMIAKPAIAPINEPGSGFKFGGPSKPTTVPRQSCPRSSEKSSEQSKDQQPPPYESSGISNVVLQPALLPVQIDQASTQPSNSFSIKTGNSSVDWIETQASDTSSIRQLSWSQTHTPSMDQSELSSALAHSVPFCRTEDMAVDGIDAAGFKKMPCSTDKLPSTTPVQTVTPSSVEPQVARPSPGKPLQTRATALKNSKNSNKPGGVKGARSGKKTKSGEKYGRAGKSRKLGTEEDVMPDLKSPINLSMPIDNVNFSLPLPMVDVVHGEEQATVIIDSHRSQSEATLSPEPSRQGIEVEHATAVEILKVTSAGEPQRAISPPMEPPELVHSKHHHDIHSQGETESESEMDCGSETEAQRYTGGHVAANTLVTNLVATVQRPSPTPLEMSKVPEDTDKPVEISQHDFEFASRIDRHPQSPSPSPVVRSLQSRSQPARPDTVLHSVSGHDGITKVTKTVSRTKKSDYISFLTQQVPPGLHEVFGRLEFAVAEDSRLRRCLMEISDQLLKDKDAEIEDVLKLNDDLAKRLEDNHAKQAELRGRLETFGPKAQKLVRFLKGLGNDMDSLKTSQCEFYATVDELAAHNTSTIAQNTSLNKVNRQQRQLQRNLNELRDDTKQAYEGLLLEKHNLERKLSRREGQIVEANDLSAVLKRQLESPTQEYIKLEKLIKESRDKTIKEIGAVHDLVGSRKDEEWLGSIEKCSEQMASFTRQGLTATECLGELKSTVENLSSATRKHFRDAEAAQELDGVSEFETRVSDLLDAMKTDIRSQEDLTAKAASLKETITVLEERLRSSEAKFSDLNIQLVDHHSQESLLKQRINQLEATNTSLQHEYSSATSIQSRLQEATLENSNLQQEVTKTKAEAMAYVAKSEELQRAKDGLQQRLSDTENLLAEARQALPDFGPERAKLEEKALQDLREYKARQSKMAQGNQNRHTSEIRQIKAYKEAAEKKLATALSELEPVKSENQLLKEQATSSKNRIDVLAAELEAKVVHIRQLNVDNTPEREKNETLERTIKEIQTARREAETAAKDQSDEIEKLQKELRNTKKNLTEADAAKKILESRLSQADDAIREQEEKHRNEISISRRGTDSQLRLAEDNTAALQESLDVQARARREVSDVGTETQCRAHGQVQRPGTAGSSQEYGSGPTNQELLQVEAQTSQVRPRKQLKKVNRSQNIGSQSSHGMPTASSQGLRIEVPQSTVPETQLDDEDMLDNRRPNSQGSGTGYDASAIDKQVLDENGVRDAEESQSQLPETSQRNYLPTGFETQSQLGSVSVKEMQQCSESSPLTSPRPEHLDYREIAAEETSANIADQKMTGRKTVDSSGTSVDGQPTWSQHGRLSTMRTTQDMSPRLHGNGALSQGKKRDASQSTPGTKSARNLPRQASQKQNQRGGSIYDEEDISDPESIREATPIKTQKRSASQRGAVSHSSSKRFRTNPGPVAKSSAGQEGTGKLRSTPERGSSSVRHTSMLNQPSSMRTSSMGASPVQKPRPSKKNSKFDERFSRETTRKG